MKRKGTLIKNKKGQSLGMGYIVIFLVMEVALIMSGMLSLTENSPFNNFINRTAYDQNGTIITDDAKLNQFTGAGNNSNTSNSITGSTFTVFDLGVLLLSAGQLLLKLSFPMVYVLSAFGTPSILKLLFGVIPSIIFVLAIFSFIRGKDL